MADLFAKYNCTYCQDDITGLRIKCAVCADFDLCLQCFSAGAEIGPHKNDHAYQFMDSGAIGMCLGNGGWSAREELHLLDAIEQFGFGNWEDISRHIETRSPEEAKEEYISRYIGGSIGRFTWPGAADSRPSLSDKTNPDCGPLSPALTARLPPLDVTPDEAALLGYMPHRDDFEREYDNGAEALVSSLFVNSLEDEDYDVALKLAQVDMYTRRLRERARRKRVSRDFQLVSQFFSANRKDRPSSRKKLSKEEKEFHDHMRVFTQFHTAQEHEQFLQNLQKERELKIRISELARYRRNGLTRHEECAHFEQERVQHEEWKEKRSGSSGSIPSPPSMVPRRRERNDPGSSFSDGRSACRSGKQHSLDNSREGVESGGEANRPDISTLPGYHLLSTCEIKLCSSLNLKPSQYITLKAILLRDHLQKGPKKEDVLPTSSSGPETHVLNYLVSSGWITAS
ncbi:transcriptional adapter 2-beta isoform X1 [Zootermopsis nevadensis]|uniref:Transcriptional adapter n=1 Tax=Zootermopsis nevadensis TaxID=136037 RepID=A0A067RT11_ZOONE|nr:transcriptional adapter 2-beta isoform X1 [Zootermopsis nevadensis]KDR23950.1 Transcriptional adapter 2B [Zootermopsis nevadensis]